jgi:hypothetical protein
VYAALFRRLTLVELHKFDKNTCEIPLLASGALERDLLFLRQLLVKLSVSNFANESFVEILICPQRKSDYNTGLFLCQSFQIHHCETLILNYHTPYAWPASGSRGSVSNH